VVDSNLSIAPQARILGDGRVLLFCARDDAAARARLAEAAAARGCALEIVALPGPDGRVDLKAMVAELGRRALNEIHVEAGYTLNGALLRERCVNELLLYFAASIIGSGQGMFNLPEIDTLEARQRLSIHRVGQVGEDLRVIARIT
jgi:diaminohydroxyphosphoribosylaminopyrimidine deaminase/5-amino-6-(5-phosphoribosylamino)uracil reductase